jgi:hypothetical protein
MQEKLVFFVSANEFASVGEALHQLFCGFVIIRRIEQTGLRSHAQNIKRMELMRNTSTLIFSFIFVAFILPVAVRGQNDDDNWPSLSYLRSDYRQVSVVARINVRSAEMVNRVGGYEDWHLVGDVVESFKGKFRQGDPIDFYHGAEKGFHREQFLGDKIIFLERNYVEQEKRWVWAVLENSTLAYNADRVQKLRLIRRSQTKKGTR